jgi:hypothetical protein
MIAQMYLTDIYRIFHPTHKNVYSYTFFSASYETFSKINPILGHKENLSKFKIFEIISCILYHNGIKLEINSKRSYGKNTNI